MQKKTATSKRRLSVSWTFTTPIFIPPMISRYLLTQVYERLTTFRSRWSCIDDNSDSYSPRRHPCLCNKIGCRTHSRQSTNRWRASKTQERTGDNDKQWMITKADDDTRSARTWKPLHVLIESMFTASAFDLSPKPRVDLKQVLE